MLQKTLLTTCILLCLSFTCFAQDSSRFQFPQKDGEIFYEYIDSSSLKKDPLYLIARAWFAKVFVSSKEVIQMDDKEAGRIIGKGISHYKTKVLWSKAKTDLKFTLDYTCKDGKYRIQCYGLEAWEHPINSYVPDYGWQDINPWYKKYLSAKRDAKGSREQYVIIDAQIKEIIALLKSDIENGTIKKAEDF